MTTKTTTLVTEFPGVLEIPNEPQVLLNAVEEEIRTLHKVGPEGRKFLTEYGVKPRVDTLIKAAKKLREVVDLSKRFLVLRRDPSLKRKVRGSDRHVIEVPLVFTAILPAKPVVTFEVEGRDYDTVRISAQTPSPTQEAAEAKKKYAKLFDHLELWWVPNDILVEPLPKPDPVLVGYVAIPGKRGFYFQLHRWIDETVECAWFAKEGY